VAGEASSPQKKEEQAMNTKEIVINTGVRPDSLIVLIDTTVNRLEYGWTQRAAARNSGGEPVSLRSDAATCWCLGGAIYRSNKPYEGYRVRYALEEILNFKITALGYSRNYVGWNDTPGRTKQEVLNLLTEIKQEITDGFPSTELQGAVDPSR
jgi:hypothetical protein